ncbi:MAG: class I SAM-dependent methyltransferase, partial [Anaerolineales bacterium]
MMNKPRDLQKAALRGEPSYVWRDGQHRRLEMILKAAGSRISGAALVDGCGVGLYLQHLSSTMPNIIGLDIDFERLEKAKALADKVLAGAGERLPFSAESFDLVLSHEVLEHVEDDQAVINEIIRTLRPRGRLVLF